MTKLKIIEGRKVITECTNKHQFAVIRHCECDTCCKEYVNFSQLKKLIKIKSEKLSEENKIFVRLFFNEFLSQQTPKIKEEPKEEIVETKEIREINIDTVRELRDRGLSDVAYEHLQQHYKAMRQDGLQARKEFDRITRLKKIAKGYCGYSDCKRKHEIGKTSCAICREKWNIYNKNLSKRKAEERKKVIDEQKQNPPIQRAN